MRDRPLLRFLAPAWLNRDLRLLFTGRALRSTSQGYLAVIVPLFLVHLGYGAERVGLFFTAGAVGSMLLTASVGLLADRVGRRPLLILLGVLTAAAGLTFVLSSGFVPLLLASAFGTVGRGGSAGSGGAFGPYFPAEQALIAEHAGDRRRTAVFGAVALVGVVSGAIGSLIATAPSLLARFAGVAPITGDRVLFAATVVFGLSMALVVVPVREAPHARVPALGHRRMAPSTRHVLGRFLVTNATNGLAVGMLGPVFVYWFYVRYGVNSAELGTLFFVTNLAAAPAQLAAAPIARRLGAVRAIVGIRAVAVVVLAAVPLMPTFVLAGALFLVRTVVNAMSNPIRQSFLMGVVDARDRSSAAGLANLPQQAASSIGPALAGHLMEVAWLGLPLELAAALQGVNALLYHHFFRSVRPPEERGSDPVPVSRP